MRICHLILCLFELFSLIFFNILYPPNIPHSPSPQTLLSVTLLKNIENLYLKIIETHPFFSLYGHSSVDI